MKSFQVYYRNCESTPNFYWNTQRRRLSFEIRFAQRHCGKKIGGGWFRVLLFKFNQNLTLWTRVNLDSKSHFWCQIERHSKYFIVGLLYLKENWFCSEHLHSGIWQKPEFWSQLGNLDWLWQERILLPQNSVNFNVTN